MTAEQKLSNIKTLRTAQNYIKALAALVDDTDQADNIPTHEQNEMEEEEEECGMKSQFHHQQLPDMDVDALAATRDDFVDDAVNNNHQEKEDKMINVLSDYNSNVYTDHHQIFAKSSRPLIENNQIIWEI